MLSLPSREAWIEISPAMRVMRPVLCRFPRGKRGLKFRVLPKEAPESWSLPSREAWIEI